MALYFDFKERCLNCGVTFGSHRGKCHNQCPKHEGKMDRPGLDECVTIFSPSGDDTPVKTGTPSKLYK